MSKGLRKFWNRQKKIKKSLKIKYIQILITFFLTKKKETQYTNTLTITVNIRLYAQLKKNP